MVTALKVYGLTAASTTLPSAATFASATGGVTSSALTKIGTSTGWGELFGLGSAATWPALGAIGSPSGNGLLWDVTTLEAQEIVAGTWGPVWSFKTSVGTVTADVWVRVYRRSSASVYTLIGAFNTTGSSITTSLGAITFTTASLGATFFTTGDKLYADCWMNITTNSTGSAAATMAISLSSAASAGQIQKAEIDTPGYQPFVSLAGTFAGVGTLVGPLSANLALPATTLVGVGALSGTLALSTALSTTFAGVGTLAGTLSANTALADTLAGVGTLTGTLSLATALSSTLAGVGTLSGTLSLNTALTSTASGIGTLSGAATYATALASTLVGTGTVSGAFSLQCALSLTCAGMGTL